jgi:hypothetical protein
VSVQAAKEITDRAGADIVPCGVPLRLYVNAVKAKGVLVDHSVNAIITRAAKGTTGFVSTGTAVAHADKQIDHEALEKLRRGSADTVKKLLSERGIDLRVGAAHDFVRRFSLIVESFLFRFGLNVRLGLRYSRPFLELLELVELAQECVINMRGVRSERLFSARRDRKVAAPRVFDQARLRQVGLGPMYAVAENCLLTRRQQLAALFWAEAALIRELFDNCTDRDFSLGRSNKNGEHQ